MKSNRKTSPPVQAKGLLWKVPLIAVLLIGLVVIATDMIGTKNRSDRATTPSVQTPMNIVPTAATPAPWHYDEANNQHWHAEHGHWHPGPPPADAATGAPRVVQTNATPIIANEATPEPWFYDAATNQHWHAGHGHWHPGPPPAESERDSPSTPH